MKLNVSEIAKSIGAVRVAAAEKIVPGGFSIDSRTLNPGDCFFAIHGKNFDGHEFIAESIGKEASLIIANAASTVVVDPSWPVIFVEDTLSALKQLATHMRKIWGKRLIGVTGSNGKTTTKEITSYLLESRYRVFKSTGNFNNEFGLPLSLLKLTDQHELAVMEMGMSNSGEIRELCQIARPDIGIVTNVRAVHLENFKSIQGIAAAKRELIENLSKDGVAVLNNDDPHVRRFGRAFPGIVLTFGAEAPAMYRATEIRSEGLQGNSFRLSFKSKSRRFRIPLIGEHNVINSLPGIAAAHHLGMDFESIDQRLQQLTPSPGRGEILRFQEGFTVINDTYNSNPAALQALIRFLKMVPGFRRKILVAGEMLELGPMAERFHRECGQLAATSAIDVIIGVRGMAEHLVKAAIEHRFDHHNAHFYDNSTAAGLEVCEDVRPGDLILIKGSRGVKTEKVLDVLKEKFRVLI
jgi:UDP-N-acetylmuramoyl-tripeptide--D-alanyl-D-alanine ligase